MPIKSVIDDPNGAGQARVIDKPDLEQGLMVYTEPARNIRVTNSAFQNVDTGSINLNVNAAFSGTPLGIHNGTDSTLWTASALSGTWTFNSTAQAHTGTRSIDATATHSNQEAQFEYGSTATVSNYTAITGWIYITKWGAPLDRDVSLYFRLSGSTVSDIISLRPFINIGMIDEWQKFTIPLDDFALSSVTVNQLIVRTSGTSGNAPDYYLDDIQLEESGIEIYQVAPNKGEILRIDQISIAMADAYDGTLANASHPNIKYNQFLGVASLTNGLALRRTSNGAILPGTVIYRNHLDLMAFPGIEYQSGGDATNTWVAYKTRLSHPLELDSRKKETLQLVLSDDLSGLLYFRIFIGGTIETVK